MTDELNTAIERYRLEAIAEWKESPDCKAWRDEAVAEYFASLPPGDEGLENVHIDAWHNVYEATHSSNAGRSAGIAAVLDLQRRRDEEAGWTSPEEMIEIQVDCASAETRAWILQKQLDEADKEIETLQTSRDFQTERADLALEEAEALKNEVAERDATIAELRDQIGYLRELRDDVRESARMGWGKASKYWVSLRDANEKIAKLEASLHDA